MFFFFFIRNAFSLQIDGSRNSRFGSNVSSEEVPSAEHLNLTQEIVRGERVRTHDLNFFCS